MAPPAPSKPRLAAFPARYAKFIAAVLGEAIVYVQLYGTTWHLDAALVCIGAALGVLGVPNAPKPAPPAAFAPPMPTFTMTQPPLSDAEVAQFKQELAARLEKGPAS